MEKIRIQKLLSDAGYCSRRKAEALIAAGKVKLNGHPVKLGDQATRADLITVNGEAVRIPRKKVKRYLMLYKPRGYVTTTSDELDRRCVMDLLDGVEERSRQLGHIASSFSCSSSIICAAQERYSRSVIRRALASPGKTPNALKTRHLSRS